MPDIAKLNRAAGFADSASKKAPPGRWKRVTARWLEHLEKNVAMLQGLVRAGFEQTIKAIARKGGYKRLNPAFFEILEWKQKQSAGGHRTIGLTGLKLAKSERFDGLSEAEICEMIEGQRLLYRERGGPTAERCRSDSHNHGRTAAFIE